MLKIRLNPRFLLIFFISLYFSIFIISPVLLTTFNEPKNTVNWFTGLYYPDYFEYLSFIKQGQQGHILLQNLFTNDDPTKIFTSWWIYPVVGYLSRLINPYLHLATVYWVTTLVLGVIYLSLNYYAIAFLFKKESFVTKLFSFILLLTATGFYNLKFVPFDFWYSIGTPFSRFSFGAPHHQIAHIFFLSAIILLVKIDPVTKLLHRTLILLFFSLLLLISSPPLLFLLWLIYFIGSASKLLDNHRIKQFKLSLFNLLTPFVISAVFILPVLFFLNQTVVTSPTIASVKKWDMQNFYYPSLWLFILTTGPLFILAILGLKEYFRKISFERLIFFLITVFCFFFCLVPVTLFSNNILSLFGFHNLRLLISSSYIFLVLSSVLFLKKIFNKKWLYACLVLLIFFTMPLYTTWKNNLKTPYNAAYLQFMPNDMYSGLKSLESNNLQGTVLTSPNSSLGIAVPAVAGRTVYFGRTIFTLNYDEKQQKANDFYQMKMSEDEAIQFIKKEGITEIVLTTWEADRSKFESHYSFLKPILQNSQLIIYSIL